MSQYLSEPYNHFDGIIKVELNLSDYTTKSDVMKTRLVDTPTSVKKVPTIPKTISNCLNNLKKDVDELIAGNSS